MNYSFLANTLLLSGTTDNEIKSILQCLQATTKEYKKDEIIYYAGDVVDSIGMVLSGSVNIESNDILGNKSILDHIESGQIFAETYSLIPNEALMVDVVAAQNCEILFLNTGKLVQVCSNTCTFHNKIVRNLLTISARKNLNLSRRSLHTSSKSIRGRLISYLSQQAQSNENYQFTIPFNRQQLADYLGVDRSAMSNELSKMQKEGILTFSKNTFKINTPAND